MSGPTSRGSRSRHEGCRLGDWILNGTKMWVTNGLLSSVVFVLMKNDTKADPPYKGMTCFIRREGAGRGREQGEVRWPRRPPEDQEDGLQGSRVDRAGLRRLPLPAGAHPGRRGSRPRAGLPSDDGRARGGSGERRRAGRRDRAARAGARRCATRRSARPSGARSHSTRRSNSSSPTWRRRSRRRGY